MSFFLSKILNKLSVFSMQVQAGGPVVQGGPKWMSRWASLADSYTDSSHSSGIFNVPNQMELSGGGKPPPDETSRSYLN